MEITTRSLAGESSSMQKFSMLSACRAFGHSPALPARGRRGMLALAAAALVAGGCSDPQRYPAPGGSSPTRGFMADAPIGELELVAARDSVDSPDRPIYPDDSVSVSQLWTASGAEWEEPIRISLSPERVFVLDAGARAIHTVTRAGAAGPRADRYVSVRGPVSIAWSGGLLAVGDTAYHHVVIFEEFGPERRSTPVGDTAYQHVVILEEFGPERRSTPGGDLSLVAAAGSRRFAIPDYGNEPDRWNFTGEFPFDDLGRTLSPPGGGDDCTRVSGGSRVILADCAVPSFRVFGPAGQLVRRVTIDRARAARLNERMAERTAAGDSLAVLAIADSLDAMDDALAPVRGVRYDERARRFAVWSATPDGMATRLDLLSAEGVYLARIRVDSRWLDFAIDGSTIYALERRARAPGRLVASAIHLPADGPTTVAFRAGGGGAP